ncbi:DNA topoisomerase 1 [Salinivirga cyanobacteriivorans]|uniref:DNA topoisomerase 1 n=1 Tax=Salinivirga cyanobacteriivorans TaxID=1307839 RepID=A0A0S2I122_9BACT|nr:type I DNA topoisomerase [Salinivirga cyanobacteriivorans]ALO16072.1 DNA topoisomerase 1 [Salinivirga cyanobacteriivorans]
MIKNLVIVESPAKAKTIEKFLGKDFTVKSSYGHIRDLAKKDLGIDKDKGYKPKYLQSPDKKNVIKELRDASKEAEMVWLASDEDREGEAIAWHLFEVLKLDKEKTRRIVFHEITPKAIKNAIENPREIDYNLVNAQQARRVLDRLVGFELSPLLWKKVKPSLSAGRVQSVAVRLLVEREREIIAFKPDYAYKVQANFSDKQRKYKLNAELNKRLPNHDDVKDFFDKIKSQQFQVSSVQKKPAQKSPAAPFTTSTLQQEAARKFGFSVSQTMTLAQRLYEAGHITYMRTDSVNLSNDAIAAAAEQINQLYGEKYQKTRKYATKSKGAQEAHEAIRPTYLQKQEIEAGSGEQRLYSLIWKRTVASQMSNAKLEKTTINIPVEHINSYKFVAQGEVLLFDGFLKVYMESRDDEEQQEDKGLLPPVKEQESLDLMHARAQQRYSSQPPRYTEASLVKKLEELGIGRPSTYAPTISTIQKRNYVVKEDRPGKERTINEIELKDQKVTSQKKQETYGSEKGKLFPTDVGMVVNDYLMEYFDNVMDYSFTAQVEKEFDSIAEGNRKWSAMIDEFYKPFHHKVEYAEENSERKAGERILGEDPKSGKPVMVRIGKYGPMAQIGTVDDEEKPQFASLRSNQHLETITLEEALDLFKLPRNLGELEGKTVTVSVGRFGPYVRHDGLFASLKKEDDPYTIEFDRAVELIKDKREADAKKLIKSFDEKEKIKVQNGKYGPYITHKRKNYRIPKSVDPEKLTYEDCLEIIDKGKNKKTKKTKKK